MAGREQPANAARASSAQALGESTVSLDFRAGRTLRATAHSFRPALNEAAPRIERKGKDTMIRVAGIEVPLAALSELVWRLYRAREHDLSDRLGRAIDSGSHCIALSPRDEAELLDALERHNVVGLDALRLQLVDKSSARSLL